MKKRSNQYENSIQEALVDLYLNIKIRKGDELENISETQISDERESLKKSSPLTLVEYIRNSVDILVDLKVEEKLEMQKKQMNTEEDEESQNDYESLLRKVEADIRQHIRMEHQLKLHSESLQARIEDLEKENADITEKNKIISEKVSLLKKAETKDKRENEINSMKSEIQNLKHILKSYEDQALKLSDLEKKLRNQNTRHEKELKEVEEKYKEKIKTFSKKLSKYEQMFIQRGDIKDTPARDSTKDHKETFSGKDKEEDLDRVNYNDFSGDRSQSKSPITARKSPLSTRKGPDSVKDKIDQYRKIIDKKISEITHTSMITKSLNKSSLNGISPDNHDRSSSNHSFITKDKTMDNTSFKSFRKNDSLIKNLETATKKMLAKENFKTHYRQSSMGSIDVKYSDSKLKDKYTSTNNPTGITKNIHAMKEMLFTNNKEAKATSTSKKPTGRSNASSNSNIVLNQGGNPCFNHITIYTSNNTANVNTKPTNSSGTDINLRQYIFNKVNTKPKSLSKLTAGRSKEQMNI